MAAIEELTGIPPNDYYNRPDGDVRRVPSPSQAELAL
jgi:hypothetical protein